MSNRQSATTKAFVTRDRHGRRFVIGVGATVDRVQAGGEWLATTDPVEVEP